MVLCVLLLLLLLIVFVASRLGQFYSDCFFVRFTSWRSQGLSEEISAKYGAVVIVVIVVIVVVLGFLNEELLICPAHFLFPVMITRHYPTASVDTQLVGEATQYCVVVVVVVIVVVCISYR